MKSITIHGLDDATDEKIRSKAGEDGLSLNRTIKHLLRKALGLDGATDRRQDFQDLFGTWSSSDLEAFSHATEDFARVDPADWK